MIPACRLAARRRTEAHWLPRGLAQPQPHTAEPHPAQAGTGKCVRGEGQNGVGAQWDPLEESCWGAGLSRGNPQPELTLGVCQARLSPGNIPFRAFCISVLGPCFSGFIFLGCECAPGGEWGGVDQARGCSHPDANPKEVTIQLRSVWLPHPSAVTGSAPIPQPFPSPALWSPSQSHASKPAGLGGLCD